MTALFRNHGAAAFLRLRDSDRTGMEPWQPDEDPRPVAIVKEREPVFRSSRSRPLASEDDRLNVVLRLAEDLNVIHRIEVLL